MNEGIKEKQKGGSIIKKTKYYLTLNVIFLVFLFFIITLDWLTTIVCLKFPIFEEGNPFMVSILNTGNWYLTTLVVYFPVFIPFIIMIYIGWERNITVILKIGLLMIIFLCILRSWFVFNNLIYLIIYL